MLRKHRSPNTSECLKPRGEDLENLPQVLAIQKKKILIAINRTNDGTTGNISQEDEQLVKQVTETLHTLLYPLRTPPSRQWNASQASMYIKKVLDKHKLFELSNYLECAKFACEIYSMKTLQFTEQAVGISFRDCITYLLVHARQFGDPTKPIFQIKALANQVTQSGEDSVRLVPRQQSQNSSIVNKAKTLIVELELAYDETKFQALNALATSFVLLILRRLMKKSSTLTHSDYYKSCIFLVIEVYLTTDDEKTKKNIQDTCLKYMEWYDMQLPCLFFKVVDLYGIDAGELWDLLSSVKSRKISNSLIHLSTEYYENYQLSKADPSQSPRWFAYCRMFDNDFYTRLSDIENVCICAVLGNLIDMTNTFKEPAYTCPDDADHVNEWAKQQAAEMFTKINK